MQQVTAVCNRLPCAFKTCYRYIVTTVVYGGILQSHLELRHQFAVTVLRHRRRQSSEVRGANVNLCQSTPCQKLKTHRIWSTFLGGAPNSHLKIKKECYAWEGQCQD